MFFNSINLVNLKERGFIKFIFSISTNLTSNKGNDLFLSLEYFLLKKNMLIFNTNLNQQKFQFSTQTQTYCY